MINLKSKTDVLNRSQDECLVWVTSSTTKALTPTAIALGNFDGVHRGHQQVIQPILQQVRMEESAVRSKQDSLRQASLTEHAYSTVVTFNPHPQEFFTGQARALLTPLDEKVQQLRHLGVEQLVLLPFDRELAALTPQEFVEKILVQQLRCKRISVGQDFRFGSKRSGTASDLQFLAAKYNIPVNIVPLQTCIGDSATEGMGERISSSAIRQSLTSGDIQRANQLLGRPYTLIGSVVKGQQLGRTIGFPTANLQLAKEKFLPRQGVYAVRVFSADETLNSPPLGSPAVMNIGCRPTINGTNPTVEVHLLDWSGDLYGQKLAVQLEKFLRSEQKFPSLEALKTQIQLDCIAAKAVLSHEGSGKLSNG